MVTFEGGNITECSYRGVFVSGLLIFPQYHFKPQDNLAREPWSSQQRVAIWGIMWLPIALLGFCITCRNSHSSGTFFQLGFSLSCAQCNAYLLYCLRNKQPARGQERSTYIFEAILSQAHVAICSVWKFFPEWKHFVVSINVLAPKLCGGESHAWSMIQSHKCI